MPPLRRWAAFNAVGILGVVVQLAVFSLLARLASVDYLPAAAISVEVAVLHNFVWHQRWTWRDRPAPGIGDVASRLVRFHLVNGAISLAGSLAVMRALVGALHIDPILATAAAIGTCSLINFVAGTSLVFRTGTNGREHSRARMRLLRHDEGAGGTAGCRPANRHHPAEKLFDACSRLLKYTWTV